MSRFTAEISHEFAAGPSGPARSYWGVYRIDGDSRVMVGTVQQPPTAGAVDWGHLDIQMLCHMLDEAFERGRADQQMTIRKALGV
jgi:hypothetical protein